MNANLTNVFLRGGWNWEETKSSETDSFGGRFRRVSVLLGKAISLIVAMGDGYGA